ncbi:MAG: GNAT family N-acetyltransferase [Anaeroplasmataceae bacterium]|nr:GNAT family N-acetyltransferase [Anaeroplasmataceae bacterium]
MNIKIDVSQITLETDRLILRGFLDSDLDDFNEYASVAGVGEMAGWNHHKSKKESAEILNEFIEQRKTFALVEKNTGKVIGSLGLERYNEDFFQSFSKERGVEIGYVLSKAYWGKGLMPEAVKEVIRFLFSEDKVDFIACGHFLSNAQSKKVIEKCGFHFYGNTLFDGAIGCVESASYILRKEDVKGEKF